MGAADHQHAQAALTDAAADGQRQFAVQQHLVEGQGSAIIAARQRQLAIHRFGIHANAHAGNFKGSAQNGVPEQDIAVQRPIIVVRRTAVVRLAGFQLAADLRQQHGAMLFEERIFTIAGHGDIGEHVLQFLCGDGGQFAAQLYMNR